MKKMLMLSTASLLTIVASQAAASIVITQLYYDMAGSDNATNEFIEIYNPTASDIDLSGWVLDDGNTSYHTGANIASGIVPAGGVAYLYSDSITQADFVTAWGNCNAVAVGNWAALGLNNTGDTVALWDSFAAYDADKSTFANTQEVVVYSDDAPWPDSNNQSSIYLNSLSADNNDGANWILPTGIDIGSVTPTGGTIKQATPVNTWTGNEITSIVNITGDNPDASTPASTTAGPITPGSSVDFVVTVTNLGTSAVLNVTGVNFSGADAGKFSVQGVLPTGIAANNGTGDITVRYSAGATEEIVNATMEITSNDLSGDVLNVEIKAAALVPQPVIITGIMYNNTGTEGDWEWIEVYNDSASTIDLSGWVVDDGNGSSHTVSPIASGTIPANETAYLFNGDALSVSDFQAAWGGVNAIPVTNWNLMQLNNTGDLVSVWTSFDAYEGDHATHIFANDTIDYETDGVTWPADSGGNAIYVLDISSDRSVGTNWGQADSGNLGSGPLTGVNGNIVQSNAAGGNTGSEFAQMKASSLVNSDVNNWEMHQY